MLVLADVDALDEVVVIEGSVVLEDLMLLLQPLRTNPARIMVNNIVVFIGGLNCVPTDPGPPAGFSTRAAAESAKIVGTLRTRRRVRRRWFSDVTCRKDERK